VAVRVGFVGAGGIAITHMNLLQMIEEVQIAAISDSNRARADSAASRFLAKPYTDCQQMLKDESLDALYVCVPPFAHEGQEIAAAEKGIHLFLEKPVGLEAQSVREAGAAIAKAGVVSAVGYHWRYQANTRRAAEMLQGKTIGMVQGYWMGGLPEVYWWRRYEQSGGQVVEQATHIYDLARYLCGEIEEVYAAYARRNFEDMADFNGYDVGAVTLKFAGGAVGTMSNTCMLNISYTVGLHIITQDLVLEIHGDLKAIEPGHTQVFTGGSPPMFEENRAFIHAVKTGDRSGVLSDYADAARTLAVTLACNESAASDSPVKVDYA
jgi:myo-inositol 2-dehydrogenase / D-chiro-inositol 1-dehydrogenase